MKIKLTVLISLALIFTAATAALAASYEELPKVIKVDGVIGADDEILCTAVIVDHSTVYEFTEFETNYTLKVLDSGGKAVGSYDFPIFKETDAEFTPFYFNVPFDDKAVAVAIFDPSGQEKCRVTRSANAPEINITYPKAGNWQTIDKIEWEMSDKDADDWLLVDVYLADNEGVGWTLVGKEVEESSVEFVEPMAATRLKLVVNDGFNYSEAVVESTSAQGGVYENLDFDDALTVRKVDEEDYLKATDLPHNPQFTKDWSSDGAKKKWNLAWLWWAIPSLLLLAAIWIIKQINKKLKIILTIVVLFIAAGSYLLVNFWPWDGDAKSEPPAQDQTGDGKDAVDDGGQDGDANGQDDGDDQGDEGDSSLGKLYRDYIQAYNEYVDLLIQGLGETEEGRTAEEKSDQAKEKYEQAKSEEDGGTTPPDDQMPVGEIEISKVTASSSLPAAEGYLYEPSMTIDGNAYTAWVEAADDDGVGQWIKYSLVSPALVSAIKIFPGYASSESVYFKNNRMKKVAIEFSDGQTQEFELMDAFEMQTIQLSGAVSTDYVKITILETWPGTDFDDTCIAEIEFE
ncbi:discoidin domain-containing protein, partial [Patescibacteria group bacterium]|nr:discoidin domain-containing protein [Patescibacteria group bacterium]MBU1921916.1 discoidin domain-containing protein [Patescibacteria group bacterium]